MKKALLLSALLVSAPLATIANAHDHQHAEHSAKEIELGQAWSRMTAPSVPGAVFISIHNGTDKKDVLMSASTPVSSKVELHNHIHENGVMKMREVKGGIPLAANETTVLQPGSYHIMLMNLKEPLKIGQEFPITLKFKNTGSKTVTVKVNNGEGQDTHQHMHH